MLELYHNAASTCSQKVRLVLEEKGLEWTSHNVDLISGGQHDADYVKLNPNHVVPTLIDGGRVFIESTLINDYLDDAYPDVAMRSSDPALRHADRNRPTPPPRSAAPSQRQRAGGSLSPTHSCLA